MRWPTRRASWPWPSSWRRRRLESYQSYVGTFTDPKLNPAIMAVGGVEARHAAVLAQVLNSLGDTSAMPVPAAFQVTDKAVMAGTGVS